MSSRTKIIISLLILALLLAISVSIYYFKFNSISTKAPQTVDEKIITGIFSGINGQSLKIEVMVPSVSESVTTSPNAAKEIDFNFNKNTKFYRYSSQAKTADQYKKDFEQFSQSLKLLNSEGKKIVGIEPPTYYNLELIQPQNIKIGDRISLYIDREKTNDLSALLTRVIVEKSVDPEADPPPSPHQEKFSGKILSISADKVNLLIDQPLLQIGSVSESVEREYIIDQSLKVYKLKVKSPEQYLVERKKFDQEIGQLQRAGQPIIGIEPPSPETKELVSITELKPSQAVAVILDVDREKIRVLELVILSR